MADKVAQDVYGHLQGGAVRCLCELQNNNLMSFLCSEETFYATSRLGCYITGHAVS